MKSKKVILSFILVLVVALISVIAATANTPTERTINDDYKNSDGYKKVQIMLNDAYADLAKTFAIDESTYTRIDYKSLNTKNENIDSEAAKLISGAGSAFPLGYTIPIVYVNNDKSVIIYCAKNEAGESMMIKINRKDNKWDMVKTQKMGKPNLKIKDIQLNK